MTQPAYLPPAFGLPTPPPSSPTGDAVVVDEGGSLALAPGPYGDLTVRENGSLTLAPGEYTFTNVTLEREVTITGTAESRLVVSGEMIVGEDSLVGSAPDPLQVEV